MGDNAGQRWGRTIGPDRVQGVFISGYKVRASVLTSPGQGCRLCLGMDPGIEADAIALGNIGGEPLARRLGNQVFVFIEIAIGLVADLYGIAAIDENSGALRQDNSRARGAVEAC